MNTKEKIRKFKEKRSLWKKCGKRLLQSCEDINTEFKLFRDDARDLAKKSGTDEDDIRTFVQSIDFFIRNVDDLPKNVKDYFNIYDNSHLDLFSKRQRLNMIRNDLKADYSEEMFDWIDDSISAYDAFEKGLSDFVKDFREKRKEMFSGDLENSVNVVNDLGDLLFSYANKTMDLVKLLEKQNESYRKINDKYLDKQIIGHLLRK